MAKVKQVGPGRKTQGIVDGLVYYNMHGATLSRALPNMPDYMFRTPEARKRQAIFTMIQWHCKSHRWTIKQSISRKGLCSPANMYVKMNYAALAQALDTLADTMVAGTPVSKAEVEQAVATYATAHPTAVVIGHLTGYNEVYLTGAWPATIQLNAVSGSQSVVIYTKENGDTVTLNPPSPNSGGGNQDIDPDNNGGGGSGAGSGAGAGDDDDIG